MDLFRIKSNYSRSNDEEMRIYPPGRNYKYNEVIKEIGFGKYQYKIESFKIPLVIEICLYYAV